MEKIKVKHFNDMDNLNHFLWLLEYKSDYDTKIQVINISSTRDGYDLFYSIIKKARGECEESGK